MKQKEKIGFLVGALLCFGFAFTLEARASTTVEANYTADQTWTAAESPYIVQNGSHSGVMVSNSAVLTIEPGVVVKFESGAQLHSSGTGRIAANGTADNPIIFTAITDDTAGGDTNGDGSATSPSVGGWNRIVLTNDADSLTYAQIRYAENCVWIFQSGPVVKNNEIRNCTTGIKVTNGLSSTVIEQNTMRNNAWGFYFSLVGSFAATQNNIYDNTPLGAQNQFTSVLIDLSSNWWGTASGPFNATSNPGGTGDFVTDGFILDNFLTAEVTDEPLEPDPEPEPLPQSESGGGAAYVAPPTVEFSADRESYKEGEGEITLTWSVTGAQDISILPSQPPLNIRGGEGELLTSGILKIMPEIPTTYRLVATGYGGETRKEIKIDYASRDPVIIVPGIGGTWNNSLDPILHTYDGLWEGLKSVGYKEDKTLFAFPYDWRKDNRASAVLLGRKIDEVLGICGCSQVDIVAHSMGGLVTRYYIQNINNKTLDQLIFLGTPHLGAPKAYFGWEAGEMGPKGSDRVLEYEMFLEANHVNEKDVVKFIRENVSSIQQLLPIYSYLTDNQTGKIYGYDKCLDDTIFSCNVFLEELNRDYQGQYNDIKVNNIINEDLPTPRALIIEQNFDRQKTKIYQWQRGRPVNYPNSEGILYGAGDGTVPINSGSLFEDNMQVINAEHGVLPYYAQSEVSKILINKEIKKFGKTPPTRWLFIGIKSPADISVTDANGNSIPDIFYSGTEDPEFITIPDPVDGEYKINVIGTGEGHFEVEAILIGDDLEETTSFEGMIKPGEEYKFSTAIATDTIQELKVESAPTPEPVAPSSVIPASEPESSPIPTTPPPAVPRSELADSTTGVISPLSPDSAPAPTASPLMGEDRGEGSVLGASTTAPKSYKLKPILLFILGGLAILTVGYLIFKKQKKW